ncbi:putative brother of CDO isoform X1 [Sesbania bispinosa]|nr:putative brother of CDO isoform X1 [Sesbania bispinosa]
MCYLRRLLLLSFISGGLEARLAAATHCWKRLAGSGSTAQVQWNARDGRRTKQPVRARRKKEEARRTTAGHAADDSSRFTWEVADRDTI